MKNLYQAKTRVSEPIAKGTLSGYGLGCLGGFVDQGKATFFPLIGGDIKFSPETLEGQVTIIRQPTLEYGSMGYGLWNDQLARLREDTRNIIKNKLIRLEDEDNKDKDAPKAITKTLTILNQFKFKAFIQTMNIANVVQKVYNSRWVKPMIGFDEEYFGMAFTVKGTQIAAEGTLQEGLDYYIAQIPNSQSQITRIRVNKGVWIAWIRHIGYDHRIAALEWARYYYVYGNSGDHTIDVNSMLDAIFDEVSKRPTLVAIPDLAAYIADTLIQIGLYNLTVAALNVTEWFGSTNFAMIMQNVSDKQISAQLKILTEEWTRPQVLVPGSDLGPKMDFNILPFWDGNIMDAQLAQPGVSICEFLFSAAAFDDSTSESTKKTDDTSKAPSGLKKLKLVQIVTINSCADGSENANHIVFNRIIGPLASLPDDGRISQICVDAVYPWILGLQQPEDSNVQLERRHWPLVYLHSVFDEPPVASENITEAMLVGLKTYLGPKFYLCDLTRFLETDPLDILINEKEKISKRISGNTLFSEKISWT